MDDTGILDLYFNRSESAITETASKYGGYCYAIAYNILTNNEDAEETVSDTYLAAWNAIPPQRPAILAAFLGRITRHISIDRWRRDHAAKRAGSQFALALEELGDCADGRPGIEEAYTRKEQCRCMNRLLDSLPETERSIFLCRYWYLDPISDIAARFGFTDTKVASMLKRTRQKLRMEFAKEGLL
ncbi:MAG: sigma-70 family RNA polymerase sigma factor [Eubacteriales bacterium]|nr:sigma-70 family RNA polymerase sigma factor [Eubacteriales bacterium]